MIRAGGSHGSYARIKNEIQNVYKQVDENEDHCTQHHYALNHGDIPVENRSKGLQADPRPRINDFDKNMGT